MSLASVTSLSSRLKALSSGSGREELRAACLRPHLLRLRASHGEDMVPALLATVGLPENLIEDDNAWISVVAAKRALEAIERALGEDALENQGTWSTHPENLRAHVHMLRVVSRPLDAYRYLSVHSSRETRVGSCELDELGASKVRFRYIPDEDDDSPQDAPVFCRVRMGLLRALPRLWGLAEAHVTEASCIAEGDDCCAYDVTWHEPKRPRWVTPAAVASAILSGAVTFPFGGWVALGVASVGSASLATYWGKTIERRDRRRASRTFEKHRIAALERGLEMHGDSFHVPGDLSGTILGGKYRITGPIGMGGSGVVYAAEHVALGAQVAIKVLRGAAARNASEIARLRREAQVQVSIQHPNVVRTFDLDEMPDGSIYVVMELLHGESLSSKMAREGVLSVDVALPAFVQVCQALAAAHERGVVHRDMKPGNIFLCHDGTAKVLDFGMSKFAAAESLTREGHTLGTPEYMSPEQCIGAPVEPRADVYALGVLIYEALTGELPIQAESRRDLFELHQVQEPKPMRELRPDLAIPPWLDEAVMQALQKDPKARPSARDLAKLLTAPESKR